jgi:hypothetical protein
VKAPPEETVSGQLDHDLAAITNRHPAVGLATGVVRDGRLSLRKPGLADIAKRTLVTEDTVRCSAPPQTGPRATSDRADGPDPGQEPHGRPAWKAMAGLSRTLRRGVQMRGAELTQRLAKLLHAARSREQCGARHRACEAEAARFAVRPTGSPGLATGLVNC